MKLYYSNGKKWNISAFVCKKIAMYLYLSASELIKLVFPLFSKRQNYRVMLALSLSLRLKLIYMYAVLQERVYLHDL